MDFIDPSRCSDDERRACKWARALDTVSELALENASPP